MSEEPIKISITFSPDHVVKEMLAEVVEPLTRAFDRTLRAYLTSQMFPKLDDPKR